jgi:predicted metalloprotease with PDZ domain
MINKSCGARLGSANGLFLVPMSKKLLTRLPTPLPNGSSQPARAKAQPASASSAAVHYAVDASDVHAHLYRITLTVAKPAKHQTLSLPVWIPGSYMVREFSKHLQKLGAHQAGKALAITQLDKHTWQVANSASGALVLTYEVYAYDNSVRTAWLDAQRGFFNPTSLCLQVAGQTQRAHHLQIKTLFTPTSHHYSPKSIANYLISTSENLVKKDLKHGNTYAFANYDELADTPFEMGDFWRGTFTVRGVVHEFVVAGAPPTFDGQRLLRDTQKIVETEMAFWHGSGAAATAPPFKQYVFMLNAVDDGYGGLEHRASTALICNRRDLPRLGAKKQTDGYTQLLGLISHEYFHTWNVKRLRPAEFATYNYAQEQYTELLWFFEGFTSYYDDLLLRRAGLIDNVQYLKLLNKTINQVMQTPGARVQSVAQSSFDAWVKYYRQDENTPNATVSYYTKGALVAMCFDLTLRREGQTTLDAVMRALYKRCKAGPMAQADFAAVLQQLGGRSFAPELAQWVHTAADLPLNSLLQQCGVQIVEDVPQLAQRLGLRVAESGGAVQVKVVLRCGAAEQAGFCVGDEWLAVGSTASKLWRLSKLDDMALYVHERAGKPTALQALVSRDKRLHTLKLSLPTAERSDLATWVLRVGDAAKVDAWLAG